MPLPEDLTEGRIVRVEHDGELYEGAIVELDLDGEEPGATVYVEEADDFLGVDADQIVEVKKSAFERLVESDPELAAEMLEEELTALMGPETVTELFEAQLRLTFHRQSALRRKNPVRTRSITRKLARRRPGGERLGAFIKAQRGSARRGHAAVRSNNGSGRRRRLAGRRS